MKPWFRVHTPFCRRSTWCSFISSHRPSTISSSGSTREAASRSPETKAPTARCRISVMACSRVRSSRSASGENTTLLALISRAASQMFRAWSEMRSKSEMVCRYLDTSSLCRWDSSLPVIFIR